MRNRWLLLGMVCGMFFTAACSDDTTPTKYDTGGMDFDVAEAGVDMAVDMAVVDMGVETAPDMSVDTAVQDTGADMAPTDAAADTAGDMASSDATTSDATTTDATTADATTSDATTADGPVGDAAQPKNAWALYGIYKTSAIKYTLNQVNLDGTGQKLFGTTPPNIDLCDIKLTGNTRFQDVAQNKPVVVSYADEDLIRLPNGDRLYHWYDGTDYGLGLLQPNGTFEAPVSQNARATSTSSCSSDYYLAVSDDGKLAAAVLSGGTKVALVKLDGTTWTGTSPASEILDITPTGTTTIKTIIDNSLTMGSKHLLFVVDETNGDDAVYTAPLDGSAKATKLTLPLVESKAPVYINWNMAKDKGGNHVALVAGSSSSKEAVIIYKDGTTPTTTIVSDAVRNYFHPGYYYMDTGSSTIEPALGISPGGKYIAFTTTSTDKKLFVSTTDGVTKWDLSSSFTQTGSTSAVVDVFGGFHWADDDNLVFWAGTSPSVAGLYHFKASTKALTNLAGSGKTAAPWDGGNLRLDGGWLAPNGKFLYVLAGPGLSAINIWSIDLTAITVKSVTTGLDVNSGAYIDTSFEPIPGTNLVAFVAKKASTLPAIDDIYVFDQSTGTTASVKNLTNITGSSDVSINDMLPSPTGKYVGYTTGSGASEKLHAVPTASGTSVLLNGNAGSYLAGAYWWAPDSTSVIYGGGTSSSKLDLKVVPVTGGASTTLHATQSYLYVFGVFQ